MALVRDSLTEANQGAVVLRQPRRLNQRLDGNFAQAGRDLDRERLRIMASIVTLVPLPHGGLVRCVLTPTQLGRAPAVGRVPSVLTELP